MSAIIVVAQQTQMMPCLHSVLIGYLYVKTTLTVEIFFTKQVPTHRKKFPSPRKCVLYTCRLFVLTQTETLRGLSVIIFVTNLILKRKFMEYIAANADFLLYLYIFYANFPMDIFILFSDPLKRRFV